MNLIPDFLRRLFRRRSDGPMIALPAPLAANHQQAVDGAAMMNLRDALAELGEEYDPTRKYDVTAILARMAHRRADQQVERLARARALLIEAATVTLGHKAEATKHRDVLLERLAELGEGMTALAAAIEGEGDEAAREAAARPLRTLLADDGQLRRVIAWFKEAAEVLDDSPLEDAVALASDVTSRNYQPCAQGCGHMVVGHHEGGCDEITPGGRPCPCKASGPKWGPAPTSSREGLPFPAYLGRRRSRGRAPRTTA